MEALNVVFIVIVGLVFGSFLNVCITRLPSHESIVRPRSRCPLCGAGIAIKDNIPLISFVLLRGRCGSCHQPIAWRYPAIELTMAALWLLSWLKFGFTIEALGVAVLTFILLGLAAMDAETMRLPDVFTIPGIALGIVYAGVIGGHLRGVIVSAASAAGAALFLLAIYGTYWWLRKRQGLGLGDVKLMALIAAWFGPVQGVVVLFLGVLAAALYGIGMSIARRKFNAAAALPLGSFICAAGIYVAFQALDAMRWYATFWR
jgi:leader peptidase (prepilin peptidase) / N-methyltransferase